MVIAAEPTMEERTARLTLLIDPKKKAMFERLCREEDLTPSQVVRRLIRAYIEERTGQPWVPSSGRVRAASDQGQTHSKDTRKSRST